MRFTLRHRGHVLGWTSLEIDDRLGTGLLEPAAGYGAVRPVLRAGAEAVGRAARAAHPTATDDTLARAAVAREQALEAELELLDAQGVRVATEYIDLSDAAREPTPVHVLVTVGFALPPASAPGQVVGRIGAQGRVA